MGAQPSRESVCPTGNCSIQAASCNATKIMEALASRGISFLDCSKINRPSVVATVFKFFPGAKRVSYFLELQGSGEVVSTAGRNDQDGESKFNQRGEMPMNRSVAAEEDNRIGIASGRWES